MNARLFAAMVIVGTLAVSANAQPAKEPVGIVSYVKVVSDKVPDVSSLEAWKKSFIADNMSDQDKALAVWKSNCMFVYQDTPPIEGLHEGCVHDAIKSFNVYGYGMCCCASARVEGMSRYLGFEARAYGINGHSIPEVKWDNSWHFLDASLLNYFTREDGKIASVEDIGKSVQAWLKDNPNYKANDAKLREFNMADGWTSWKKGPALLANCKFYDASGFWPAKTHGWYSTMQEFDGTNNTPFSYEYGYSQGYQVNVQLRPGERLTRSWFHKNQDVNTVAKDGGAPGALGGDKENFYKAAKTFNNQFFEKWPDTAPGRVGSATLEYAPPLAEKTFASTALRFENLRGTTDGGKQAITLADGSKQGILEIRMPTSYVYLDGKLKLSATVGNGGKINILLSDNNGLDWNSLAKVEQSGQQNIDLSKSVLRRYDYRLRFVMSGNGTSIGDMNISNDMQCSQRALPALGAGENTISFSTGPDEGTITIEGTVYPDNKAKHGNLVISDFHPELKDIDTTYNQPKTDGASITFPIATPGDMTRLRFGGHMRLRDVRDQWEMSVSFDGGKTFTNVAKQTGPYQGICKYVTDDQVPAGTRQALVRFSGQQRNTCTLFLVRIDADYKQPAGGFRPVKVAYAWEEGGIEKKDEHIARGPQDTWKIKCDGKPEMKSIVVELAE